MHKEYTKPEAEIVKFQQTERIMDGVLIPSAGVTEDDEEGV